MRGFFAGLKFFIGTHKAASIAVASVLGLSAIGGAGYGIYNLVHEDKEDDVVVEVVVDEEQGAEDVYIPDFKNIVLTSESLEKDLTIYISDENDNAITGVPFSVKLMSKDKASELQTYVDAITDIDNQINDIVGGAGKSTETSEEADSEEAVEATEEAAEGEEQAKPSEADRIRSILQDRNVAITVTDEKGEVVDKEKSSIKDDPLYQLYLDKETAIQSFAMALKDAEGQVYTDDDEDGVIQEKDMTPGDYVACVMYDFDNQPVYAPVSYETDVNVKDKVELKVQKEIIKQVKKDAPKEDGQKKEAVPVENTLKDTVEFVESKKVENGSSAKGVSGADITAPKTTAKASKVAVKDKGRVKVAHKLQAAAATEFVITYNYQLQDADGKAVGNPIKAKEEKLKKDATPAFKPEATYKSGDVTYKLVSDKPNPAYEKVTAAKTYTFTYKSDKKVDPAKYTFNVKYVCGDKLLGSDSVTKAAGESVSPKTIDGYKCSEAAVTVKANQGEITFHYEEVKKPEQKQEPAKYTFNVKYVCGDKNLGSDSVTKAAGESVSPKTIDGYKCTDSAVTVKENQGEITFHYEEVKKPEQTEEKKEEKVEEKKDEAAPAEPEARAKAHGRQGVSNFAIKDALIAAKIMRVAAQTPAAGTEETATLDMSYKEGVFTIVASKNVTDVKVNGTAVTMKDGKGTFTATADGDYKLTGTPVWSDKVAATDAEKLYVVYTVSGFGTASTQRLKDKAGNELFLDEGLTKPATAADYGKDKTFYYKAATYTYYGWQTIDGNTYYFDKNANKVTGTQVIQGVQYDFGADGVLVVKGNGIDVSKYQGNIDWKSAKSAVNFAIIRCGYRGMYDGQLHEDPYFYKNMSGAKSAGVNVGVYIYSTALNEAEAVQEASMAVAMAAKAGGCSYPIFLDMEDTVRGQSSLSTEQRMAIVNAFVTTVQSSGYRAGFYCSKNWMTGRMNAGAIPGSCSIWIAQYNTSCTYSGRKNIWQYSSKGSVPGIKGYVDMNKAF
ncbi:Lyzozyme M1 (1,4-beta-N-acetylmuramidase), GH25 family [Pseudobutyrivibrio sp. YE44]|uniref:glycoside hydrolase family 25 protein n=1 Tax=Pseudobutyrivibrio sp. YE44 TaxID=1520802 RepID=UPI0008915FC7|nr:GH25 family lysozyme [Pseudobutyrivibrio sp. YE44]SDB38377.1 Lyzozyme M1 (1,4-beta-N-acetylmuramidase), GH25 family [Pseudobutyrivibrio sp. YE44]